MRFSTVTVAAVLVAALLIQSAPWASRAEARGGKLIDTGLPPPQAVGAVVFEYSAATGSAEGF